MPQANYAEIASLNRLLPDLTLLETLISDEGAATKASLNRLLPDLTLLETLIADELVTTNRTALLALRNFADNVDLARVEELLVEAKLETAPLDFLCVLDVHESEVAHSNFLGWLLDPERDHWMGDHFLKYFMQETAAQAEKLEIAVASPDEIDAIDWSVGNAHREAHYIDILIVNHPAKFLCAIENKIRAEEGDRQLSRYRKFLETKYLDYTRHYVFLTPNGRQSQEKTERAFWVPTGYATILELLERTVIEQGSFINEEVRAALQFYATALRRHIVPESTEIQRLARKIYLEHHEAIELINQHKPDFVNETKPIFRQAIAQHPHWTEEGESPQILRFSSKDWDRFDSFRTGTAGGWGNPIAVLLFEIDYRQGHPRLGLMLGPGSDESVRSKIHMTVSRHRDVFSDAGRPLITYRSLDRKSPITEVADFSDDQRLRGKIMDWMDNFAQNEFLRMNEIIMQAFCEYEAGK